MDWKRDAVGGTSMRTRYRADGYVPNPGTKWKPSIFCTRKASRITLEVTGVRVERLQEISEEDVIAEGCEEWCEYAELWNSINRKDSWAANPWVWVVSFRKVDNA